QGGNIAMIVCGQNLDQVHALEVYAQTAVYEQALSLVGGKAPNFGCARSRGIGRIEKINIKGDVHGLVGNALADDGNRLGNTHVMELGPADDAHALAQWVVERILAVKRATYAHLNGVLGLDQALFERPVKRRAMVIGMAEVVGRGIAVR